MKLVYHLFTIEKHYSFYAVCVLYCVSIPYNLFSHILVVKYCAPLATSVWILLINTSFQKTMKDSNVKLSMKNNTNKWEIERSFLTNRTGTEFREVEQHL